MYSRRKEVFKDYIRLELSDPKDARLVAKHIRLMKSDFKGRIEMRVQQARNAEIWRDELEIVRG